MRRGPLQVVVSVAASVTMLAACSSAVEPTSSSTSAAGFDVRLNLDHVSVKTGTTIHGTLTVINNSGKSALHDCNTWYIAGLTNAAISFDDMVAGVGCPANREIPTGTSSYPVSIIATYPGCTEPNPGAKGSTSRPMCVGSEGTTIPPLPAGVYSTRVDFLLPGVTLPKPPPIRVTLTN